MDTEWQEALLTDLYDISSGLSKPAKDFGSGHPFLAFKDVFNNFFIPEVLTQLVQSNEREQEKCSVSRGDVFLTRTSETMNELGMSSVALKDYPRATFNGFTKRLRPKACNKLVPEFVGYYLRSQRFRREMLAFSTMSTRASLNNQMIGHLRIKFPSIGEQKAIGNALKRLDDKIELNRQMNATLETMAQALFKSWFVDFDPVIDNALAAGNPIPEPLQVRADRRAALGDKRRPLPEAIRQQLPSTFIFTEEMGWVPDSWHISNVGSEVDTTGGGTPSTKEAIYWEGGTNGFCTPKDMSQLSSIVLLDTERHLTKAGVKKISSGILPAGTVLMSSRAPIGYLAISNIPVSVNQGIIAMLPSLDYSSLYLLFWAHFNMDRIRDRANGSTFMEISKTNFRPIPFLVPGGALLDHYNKQASVIYSRILLLSEQVEQLEKLRDALLPKLLSGQIRIPEAEKHLAEAS
ncbi:MAG: restriction endonuclease subunit S [Pseudomonadales bacterium]|nr:restriction endonuclease subunit S [Pseudomonadales bacterium]